MNSGSKQSIEAVEVTGKQTGKKVPEKLKLPKSAIKIAPVQKTGLVRQTSGLNTKLG